eukprot:gene1386-1751_t
MKNIFRRSVQIFHKKDKEGSTTTTIQSSNDKNPSPQSSLSKKDKKNLKHHNNGATTDVTASATYSPGMGGHQHEDYTELDFKINPNARRVFGVPLSEVPCRPGCNVPIIVEKLVKHLEATALTTEGLFRIPGRDVTINQYVRLFDNGEDVDVSPIEPYDAAGLLKRFFRDLPVFVPQQINKRVAPLFVSEDGKKKQIDMEILTSLRFLVHLLPPVHFEVMESLTGLLSKLMSKSDENKMTIANIAICLVPTLNCVPAIVTYPIQYHPFFFREVFPEHHHYNMRPYQTNLITTVMEERLEHLSSAGATQPMLIPNELPHQKRYSRPQSITISGSLLPGNNGTTNASPSSSTITSTTITSPHDSVTPITFTVTTTTFAHDEQQQQQQSNSSNPQQQIPIIQTTSPSESLSTKSGRRGYKFDPNDLQSLMNNNNFNNNNNQSNPIAINNNNTNNTNNYLSPQFNNNDSCNNSKIYRRSVAFGDENKVAIQQIREKIDRYSKEKRDRTKEEKEREKLLRYSIDFERFKERYSKDLKEKRSSRDIDREIEREIEKRLSPRERLNILMNSTGGISSILNNNNSSTISSSSSSSSSSTNSNPTTSSSTTTTTTSTQLPTNNNRSYRYSICSNNINTINTNTNNNNNSNRYSNRFINNNNDFRYSREYEIDEYINNLVNSNNNINNNNNNNNDSQFIPLSRQRSQSCFEPEIPINNYYTPLSTSSQQIYHQQPQQPQQPSSLSQSYTPNPVLEQKLEKIRETINNINLNKDRNSRDYTKILEDLKTTLQKETKTSEFYAYKNIELEDRLRREEEKNQRLLEEIHLLETYFILKEKSKLSKRLSTTKEILTRGRSPTLPISIGAPPSLNSSSNSISLSSSSNNANNNSNIQASTSPSKEAMMNQMLRGGPRKLVNLVSPNQN